MKTAALYKFVFMIRESYIHLIVSFTHVLFCIHVCDSGFSIFVLGLPPFLREAAVAMPIAYVPVDCLACGYTASISSSLITRLNHYLLRKKMSASLTVVPVSDISAHIGDDDEFY